MRSIAEDETCRVEDEIMRLVECDETSRVEDETSRVEDETSRVEDEILQLANLFRASDSQC
jgi:hypothetical protein